ncbi:copper homeostasis protein CutC [Sphingomonas sp. BK069]|uniref:copper homeostasis protein CutC n=1 Tax=Sphingomonas sp. BK069 TaxID=2586979 RepID=UPI001621C081|nr:copper homeostasis protein CutC [Sphingomonas sp. BK069]MBB3346472.1 copper homeostasis protein [Sphingomonas sp. BK069]
MRRLLEVCVEDTHGIAAAVNGGADRIELCAALDVGGLTPSPSLIRAAASAPIPVHLLVRPRAGDFVYDAGERRLVEEDIGAAADAGLAGVVIGANARDGRLDTDCLARWVEVARDRTLSLTLHRAFDLTPDPLEALEQAVALGFDRILTSGGAPRAIDATDTLTALVAAADDRITVLVGSGVSPATLPALLATGAREVHASCRVARAGTGDATLRRFGFVAATSYATDQVTVAGLAAMLRDEAA